MILPTGWAFLGKESVTSNKKKPTGQLYRMRLISQAVSLPDGRSETLIRFSDAGPSQWQMRRRKPLLPPARQSRFGATRL